MNKAFAFDVDGTLINKEGIVQKSHIDALVAAKAKGHQVVICTGRPIFQLTKVLEQLPKGLIRYAVCNNGAYIFDLLENKMLELKEVPAEIVKSFDKVGKKLKLCFVVHTTKSPRTGVFWDTEEEKPEWYGEMDDHLQEMFSKNTSWDEAIKIDEDDTIVQVSYIGTYELALESIEELKKIDPAVNAYNTDRRCVDVNPRGSSKAAGIEILTKMIGVPMENFIAFGDSGNDLLMLEKVGIGIAMGNATKEAKEIADITIGDHNTSAIADKVLELI